MENVLTLKEVAERLKAPLSKVRKLIREGKLTPVISLSDNDRRVRESVVEQMLRILEGEGDGPENRIARVPRRRPVE